MPDPVQGNEDMKREITAKAVAYFESMMIERPQLKAAWETLNANDFNFHREAWIHGFPSVTSGSC